MELDHKAFMTFPHECSKGVVQEGSFPKQLYLLACLLQSACVIHSGGKQNMLLIRLILLLVMLFILVCSDDIVLSVLT